MGSGHPFDGLAGADAERWLGTEHFHIIPTHVQARHRPVLEPIGAQPLTEMPRS
jgi:hypothetical protein